MADGTVDEKRHLLTEFRPLKKEINASPDGGTLLLRKPIRPATDDSTTTGYPQPRGTPKRINPTLHPDASQYQAVKACRPHPHEVKTRGGHGHEMERGRVSH
jgi:hypothetical protein